MRSLRPEAEAKALLESAGITSVPVDVVEIALSLGLFVAPVELGSDVSGMLVMHEVGGAIGYNPNHAPARQRFTIAHEIGHYILHRDEAPLFIDKQYSVVFRNDRSSTGEDRREREANAFASALLMPDDQLRSAAAKVGFDLADDAALTSLARRFGVSKQALSYRLAALGLF